MSKLTIKILNPSARNILDGLVNDGLIEVGPFASAIAEFQEGMRGVAERCGIRDENDVAEIVAEIRREIRNENQPLVAK
jgi:hypothetical protein